MENCTMKKCRAVSIEKLYCMIQWEIDLCGLRTVRDLVSSVVVAAGLISIGESIIICEKVSLFGKENYA